MTKLSKLKKQWMQDADVREAYDAHACEFEIAPSLIEARSDAGLTQVEVAKRMGEPNPLLPEQKVAHTPLHEKCNPRNKTRPLSAGGELESEPYRIMAAETLSYWLERIHAKLGNDIPVLVMGDFNDAPFNRSIRHYALGLKDSAKVKSKRSRKPYLFNLMWSLQYDGSGSHYFNGWNMLDQILVNRALLRNEGKFKLIHDSCQIFNTPAMLQKGKPRRFSRPSAGKKFDPQGYSDHLPVSVRLQEKTQSLTRTPEETDCRRIRWFASLLQRLLCGLPLLSGNEKHYRFLKMLKIDRFKP